MWCIANPYFWIAACLPIAAIAQSYPVKPIRVVSDSASGSPGDVGLRMVTPKMSAAFGQPVIVEPRTGAGGQIAANEVLKNGADGYSILFSTSLILASKFVLKSFRLDMERDFAPISMALRGNNFMAVHKSVPANSFIEFVDFAKKNPGKLTFSSNGIGSSLHIQWVGVNVAAGIDLLHVPYGSGNNSMRVTDFFVGRTHAIMNPLGTMRRQLEAGEVRVLAMMADERNKSLPAVPAITEVLPGVKLASGFWGFWGAAEISPVIVNRLSGEIQKGYRDPEIIAKLELLDSKPVGSTPQEFAAAISSQMKVLKEIADAAGITPQ
ncbi:MAG: tripartite tricarboxylate transporter substrate binding protein [Betaproteobacteria bacterium]|nr:tripartite tricarboxylate transporter substrate binding protein [Betaproteobacteria bacterium]